MYSIFQFLFGLDIWRNGMLKLATSWDVADIFIFIGAVLLIAAVGYLCGSVNTAILLTRFIYREDIRQKGSGNPGMTNVMRTYGFAPAALTLLGDMLKTMLGMMAGTVVFGITGAYIGGLFGVIGHIAPVFYKFKGGKGVAAMFMFLLYADSLVFVIVGLVFVLIVGVTKYLSLGSVMCALIMPLVLNRFDGYNVFLAIRLLIAFVIAGIIVYKHRANISRIMNKTENKFSFKKTKKKSEVMAEATGNSEDSELEEELTPEVLARKEANRKKSAKKKK